MKKIKIKINGKEIVCEDGTPLGKIAREHGIFIPALCFHKDFPVNGNCRVCVVEIKGQKKLAASCHTKVFAGMEVFTDSERVKKERNINLELIFQNFTVRNL